MAGVTAKPSDHRAYPHAILGVVIVAAGLVGVAPSAAPAFDQQIIDVRLAGDSSTDSIALVMGASGVPTPAPISVETTDRLYLEPNGFTGHAEALTTPELNSDTDATVAGDVAALMTAINTRIDDGDVSAANPLWVFGYSQSAAAASEAMEQLHDQGVPADDLHFVLVGDPASPYGGLLATFLPSLPGWLSSLVKPLLALPGVDLSQTMGVTTPDYYPTDVYTLEYDGFADFPRYPFNLLADLNAFIGLLYEHEQYLGLSPDQIANATPMETAGDALDHYYMIHSEYLPLLVPLALVPIIGKPLYDLLEPDTRLLVNLGYGDITDDWNSEPADVDTTSLFPLLPPGLNGFDVLTALGKDTLAGLHQMLADLVDPSTYQLTPIVDNPALSTLITALYQSGGIDTPHPSSLLEVLDAIAGDLSGHGL